MNDGSKGWKDERSVWEQRVCSGIRLNQGAERKLEAGVMTESESEGKKSIGEYRFAD